MSMNISFNGKTVLVVGGGRGIGKEIALTFADCGANVVVGDYNAENGEGAAKELRDMGREALFVPCNVVKRDEVEALVEKAVEFGGGALDVIVNAAGVASSQDTINISDEEFHRIININLLGATNVFRAGLRHMKERKQGNMIVLSSVAGRTGGKTMTIYSASKAATINLMQAAAKTGAPYGVRVNSIAPGYVRTEIWEPILDGVSNGFTGEKRPEGYTAEKRDDDYANQIKNHVPLGRTQTCKDIAWAAAFLASDYAKEITGQVMAVDGGATMC